MLGKVVDRLLCIKGAERVLLQESWKERDIFFINVNPREISHISMINEGSPMITGETAKTGAFGGCFDLIKKPFSNHFMYRTVQDMLNGEDWKCTAYYKKLIRKKTESEAIRHLEKLKHHIEMLADGYKSQYELGKLDQLIQIGSYFVPIHETLVGMDRKGRLFRIKGGRHRLAVAQQIGLIEMPAILSLYHKDAAHLLPKKRRKITGDMEDFRPL